MITFIMQSWYMCVTHLNSFYSSLSLPFPPPLPIYKGPLSLFPIVYLFLFSLNYLHWRFLV